MSAKKYRVSSRGQVVGRRETNHQRLLSSPRASPSITRRAQFPLADTFDDGFSEEPIVYPDEGDLISNAEQEYTDSEWTLRTNGWMMP